MKVLQLLRMLIVCMTVTILLFSTVNAADSLLINYQGYLTDETGSGVTDDIQMTFTFYDAGGTSYWSETHLSVTVTNGLFNVILGSQTKLESTVFSESELYLGINVGTTREEILPRTLLTSVPGAARADKVQGDMVTEPGIIRLHPPDPCLPPDPCDPLGPAFEMSADGVINELTIFQPPPDDSKPAIKLTANSENKFDIYHPDADPASEGVVQMGATAGKGAFIECHASNPMTLTRVMMGGSTADTGFVRLFGGPDGAEYKLLELNSHTNTGGVIKFFDSENIDGRELLTLSSSPTEGTSIVGFTPQPEPPGLVAFEIETQETTRGAGGGRIAVYDTEDHTAELTGNTFRMDYLNPTDETETSVKLSTGQGNDGIIIVHGKPGEGVADDSVSVQIGVDTDDKGIIIIGGKPGDGTGGSTVEISAGLEQEGIIIIGGKPASGLGESSVEISAGQGNDGIIIVHGKPGTGAVDDSVSVQLGMDAENRGVIIVNNKPGDETAGSSSVGISAGLEEQGIIIVNNKPGAGAVDDSVNVQMGIDAENRGIIIVNNKPGDGTTAGSSVGLSAGPTEEGIIIVNNLPAPGNDSNSVMLKSNGSEAGLVVNSSNSTSESETSINLSTGLEEQGIIIVNNKPGEGTVDDSVSIQMGMDAENKGIIIVNTKPGNGSGGASIGMGVDSDSKGIIIVNTLPADASEDSMAVSVEANSTSAELTLFKGSATSFSDIALRVNSDGARVGIGTNSPSDELYVVGDITATGSITEISSQKYKTNIIGLNNALSLVSDLRGVRYDWRTKDYPKLNFEENTQIGMIAEEVEDIIPELVHADANGEKSVNYSKMTAVLVEAIKELKAENELLKKRLDKLEKGL